MLRSRYADFGPTLAHEKLTEVHHLTLGRETVRHLMIQAGLWHPRRARKPVVHPLRERRTRLGELVQIDVHRTPGLKTAPRSVCCWCSSMMRPGVCSNSTSRKPRAPLSYFEAVEAYVRRHGKPVAFYSDKLGVFRINQTSAVTGTGLTQFGRAMEQLAIQVICANTPQAKGRVERVMQTLQDRLVKEMRLRGISSMARGNAYLPEFMDDFNTRFAVAPRQAEDAHRRCSLKTTWHAS